MSKREKVIVVEYLDGSRLFDALFENGENIDSSWFENEPSYTPDLSVATRYNPKEGDARLQALQRQETDPAVRQIFCVSEKLAFTSKAS